MVPLQPLKDKRILQYTPEEEREIFKIAVAQINVQVFVYDLSLRMLYFFNSDLQLLGSFNKAECCLEDIKNSGSLDTANFALLENLFLDMHQGKKNTGAIIKSYHEGKYTWSHVTLINCYNHNGKPIRAIGTIQDISSRVEIESRYYKEKQFRMAILAEDSRRVYEINVTQDRFAKLESIQDSTDYGDWALYDESMADLCHTRVFREDWEAFLKVATRKNLLWGFENGITEFYCEYRFIDKQSQLRWSASSTHLLRDPVSNDIKGYIYVKDIDQQKRQELELYQLAQRDPLVGIYNRRAAESLITQILSASQPTQLHGLLNLDIDEFKQVNDLFGHAEGDALLQQLAAGITGLLSNRDIFARMGGDEFIVFLKDVDSAAHILTVANRICAYARSILIKPTSGFRVTLSIGIATYPKGGTTFKELYENSDRTLYTVKQQGKDHAALFTGAQT